MSCKEGDFVSIRHNGLRDLTAKMLPEVCKDTEIKTAKINTVNERRVSQQNCKHNKCSKTWHYSTWSLGQGTICIFRFKGFWSQRLPLFNKLFNERTRKEKSLQQECFSNWICYVYIIVFFRFMEVWGRNAIRFIQDHSIYYLKNVIYRNR